MAVIYPAWGHDPALPPDPIPEGWVFIADSLALSKILSARVTVSWSRGAKLTVIRPA